MSSLCSSTSQSHRSVNRQRIFIVDWKPQAEGCKLVTRRQTWPKLCFAYPMQYAFESIFKIWDISHKNPDLQLHSSSLVRREAHSSDCTSSHHSPPCGAHTGQMSFILIPAVVFLPPCPLHSLVLESTNSGGIFHLVRKKHRPGTVRSSAQSHD